MTNKEIERAATAVAERLLAASGYHVSSHEGQGFDLVARKGNAERHIEVKGAGATVVGAGGFRYLTSGEFDTCRQDPGWELWVIENVNNPAEATVMRIRRDEVLARCKMEISWTIPIGAWCQENRQPLDQGMVEAAVQKATA